MLNKKEIINSLLEKNRLWDIETQHEAKLLCKAIFEKWPEHRDTLEKFILKGPARFSDESEEDCRKSADYEIFNLLSYLERETLSVSGYAKKYLEEIRLRHPNWVPREDFYTPSSVGMGPSKSFSVDDLLKEGPEKVIRLLKEYQELRSPWSGHRELSETVGSACSRSPSFCLQFFTDLVEDITEITEDTINPIFWSIRSEEAKKAWKIDHINILFSILESLIKVRTDAGFWNSLPSLLRDWSKSLDLKIDVWGNLATPLWKIFVDFDYDRKDESNRVDWINRAINHPFGILTELYLETAYKSVSGQAKIEKKYEVDPDAMRFFEFVVDNYDAHGARYGICILAKALGWFDAVSPDWTKDHLLPLFYLARKNREATLIIWSGYLWNRTLSRSLIQNFKESYLALGEFYSDLSEQDRKSLIVHIAGLSWFMWIDLVGLKEFVLLIDRQGRQALLHSLGIHFKNAEENLVEKYWQTTLLPYWDWCGQQGFLELPEGDKERFDFWRLIPYSHAFFPEAKKRAIHWVPDKIEQIALFPKKIAESNLGERFPEDFIEFLIAFIRADRHPDWHNEDWVAIWDNVKTKKVTKLEELKNELARTGVIKFS